MQVQAHALERAVRAKYLPLSGTVTLSTPPVFASQFLAPRLATMRRLYPDLHLTLLGTKAVASLSQQEADIAVRISRPREASSVARKIGTMEFWLYAAPGYDARPEAEVGVHRLRSRDGRGVGASLAAGLRRGPPHRLQGQRPHPRRLPRPGRASASRPCHASWPDRTKDWRHSPSTGSARRGTSTSSFMPTCGACRPCGPCWSSSPNRSPKECRSSVHASRPS